jgi:hypothetical protein
VTHNPTCLIVSHALQYFLPSPYQRCAYPDLGQVVYRHSHASLLIDLGANPLAVAQRMGHSDAAFTLRVYGHLFEGVQSKLSEQLDALRIKTANTPRMGAAVNLDARRDLTQTGLA